MIRSLLRAYPEIARMKPQPTTIRLTVPGWRSRWSNTLRMENRGRKLWAHLFCGHLLAFNYWTPWQVFRDTHCPAHRSHNAPRYAAPTH